MNNIDYKLVRKKGMKNIYLKITKKCEIRVSCGLIVPKYYINDFVQSKKEWIQKQIIKCKEAQEDLIIKDGAFIEYLGDKYIVNLDTHISNRVKLEFKNSIFYIKVPKECENIKILKKIDEFYKQNIQSIIEPIIDKYTNRMQLYPTKITYRKTVSRWGSCSFNNEINFSSLLATKNIKFIEYVVVHELAHMVHKNHSKEFYELVDIYLPNVQY